ncbi:MAG: GNAT family N-acetyltransferase [Actinomadura sp.]
MKCVRPGDGSTHRGGERSPATLATYMVQPTADLRATFLAAMREFAAETGTTDADGHTVAELEAADFLETYTQELCDGTCLRVGVEPLRCCEWWLVETDPSGPVYLGRVSLRRYPGRGWGHLDFAIRPSRRREGHGTALLALALPIARANGVPEPVLVCDEGHVAARKVIEGNDGRLVKVDAGRSWYRVPATGSRLRL